ncbi:FAD/NAD(P)-binding domain-containing protein [Mycena kentingensis (nom. inval.)]|nr:FAD/NAD(P)-binding domain-containing protein [Mycena kentingensis (nom. inval.)]
MLQLISQLAELSASTSTLHPARLKTFSALITALDLSPASEFAPQAILAALRPSLSPPDDSDSSRYEWAESSPEAVAQTEISGAALEVIAVLCRRCGTESLVEELSNMWPLVCVGMLKYVRALVRPENDPLPCKADKIGSPGHAFTTVVTMLHLYASVDCLRVLVQGSPEALALVVRLWQFEAEDQRGSLSRQLGEIFPDAAQPPSSAQLVFQYIFSLPQDEWDAGVVADAKDNAFAAIMHIARCIHLVYSAGLSTELLKIIQVNLENLASLYSTDTQRVLLALRSSRTLTELLVALTSYSFHSKTAPEVVQILGTIFRLLSPHIAANGIADVAHLIDSGLLVGLLRVHPWLDRDPQSAAFADFKALLTENLPKYLIYASVLRAVHQSIHAIARAGGSGVFLTMPSSPCSQAWQLFYTIADARIRLARDGDMEPPQCNASKCRKPGYSRCGRCLCANYCSTQCQLQAWTNEGHSAVCLAPHEEGFTPILTPEDTTFASVIAYHDLLASTICDEWRRQGTLPLHATMDYTTYPPQFRVSPPPNQPNVPLASVRVILPNGGQGDKAKSTFLWNLWVSNLPYENLIENTIYGLRTMPGTFSRVLLNSE